MIIRGQNGSLERDRFHEYDRKKTDKIYGDYVNEMHGLIKSREEAELTRLQEIADKSPYKLRVVKTQSGTKVAVQNFEVQFFDDAKFVLGYAAHVERLHGCRNIAIYKAMFEDMFFYLSSGLADELSQKLADSGYRIAIIGDFSGHASESLQDFICESNKGGHLYFVADEDEALRILEGF